MTTPRYVTIDADILPRFTACYLRLGGATECAFIEAHTAHALPRLMDALARESRRPEDVRYIIVTHAHLDHAAGTSALAAACPNAIVVAHPRTAKHLIDPQKLVAGAVAVYGESRVQTLYGEISPIAAERVRSLGDGESLELDGAKLTAWHTYGHAYHHFIIDDPATETVFTGDTFGLVYPDLQEGGLFAFPSTSPTGFNAEEAKKSIAKVLSLNERLVCPTHFGPHDSIEEIAAQLQRFIDRAEAWRHEASRQADMTAEALEARFVHAWWSAIAEEAPHFGPAEKKLLELDVELNAQGLASVVLAARK